MRDKIFIAAILTAALSAAGFAAADTTSPVAAPSPTPAAAPAVARVLVIPFTMLNVPDNLQWISKAVQEDVVSDLGRSGSFVPLVAQNQVIVEDNATAVKIGKEVAAAYVVRGAVQQIDNNIRLTGQMIDTSTGDTVETASATGPEGQLLTLEDQLSAQLRGVSTQPLADSQQAAPAQTVAATGATPTLVPASATTPQIVYVPVPTDTGTTVYTPPCDYTPYAYDYSGYYPGYYSSPIIIYGGGFGRFGSHDGFHNGGGFGVSGGRVGGGFNTFHSPSTVSTGVGGAFNTAPVFHTTPVFNSSPAFSGRTSFSSGGFSGGSFSGGGGGFHGGGGRR